MQVTRLGAGVLTIDGFLSPEECTALIVRSEAMGYSEAAIQTDDGDRLYKEARNNDRIIFDDNELALKVYERAKPCLPAELDGWRLSGLNPRWRYYRYGPEQKFTWHQDGTVRISPEEESLLTFMIYLNADFEGGSTDFGWDSVRPVQGRALVFPHRLRHQGAKMARGVKYVLRSDVMYASQAAPGQRCA
ncbi:2OG-Fe(II) oxygenase [Caldimonas brevitalea]|uniref:Iron-regulated protein n=1 Tax=Caldimonas brevitalea TaxID=413882 RepID=A0A0G3BS69_9BURK|nr:2OG-Fe(II) oxygenase [Caldimonas brevitalea]AKJ30818.1 iron-regulated protein [Caldimonas brevitalea]